jgi:oligopeptide transport system substrate-binding protein
MKTRRWLPILFFFLTVSLFFQAPLRHTQAASTRANTLYLSGGESGNPDYYDPATTRGSGDKRIFSGLVSFDPHLQLTADLADHWTVKDGTIFTFTLRANARFQDGRPVTAEDFVYSWERAANPKTHSPTVQTYLGDIVGVREMQTGKADHISGLRAVDAHTLEVTIDAPKPYFLFKLTYPTAFVVDRKNVESGSDWYRHPNGTGPYRLTKWDSMQQMVYQRNENFYLGAPAIQSIVVTLYAGVPARLYETNDVDIAPLGSNDVPRMLDPANPLHAELVTGVDLCTDYAVFDTTRPPFDDPSVRQAFSMAVNRPQYLDMVTNNLALDAPGLYPPGLPGRREGLSGIAFDPEKARARLAQSKYAGSAFPSVAFLEPGYGSQIGPNVSALVSMWKQNLGVTVSVINLEPDRYLDVLGTGQEGTIWEGGWCADYPDPENFADALFHTGAPMNEGGYANPTLDTLLEAARSESDVSKRMAKYQQAEDIIIADAPVLFLTNSLSYTLVKPYIRGFVPTPIAIPIERYLSIDAAKLPR